MKRSQSQLFAGLVLAFFFAATGNAALASDPKKSVSVDIQSQDDSKDAKIYAFLLRAEINQMLLKEDILVLRDSEPSELRYSVSGGVYVTENNRMAIKAELVHVATGKVVWAESYNRDIEPEVDTVASDVVKNVVARMKSTKR